MPLITLVATLICVGILLFGVNRVPFIDGNIKTIIYWVVIVCTALWVLNLFGVFGPLSHIRVGR